MAANTVVGDGTRQKYKLIQAFVTVLVICKDNTDPSKMKALECSQNFSNCKSMGIFQTLKGNSAVPDWTMLNFEPVRDFMIVPATCKLKKIQLKMEELECSQDVPHYNSMETISDHGTRVPIASGPKP